MQPNIFNFDGNALLVIILVDIQIGCHIDHITPAKRELIGGHPEIDSLNRSALVGQL